MTKRTNAYRQYTHYMQADAKFKVILAGKRMTTHVLLSRDNLRVNKDENGKRKMFPYPCCLKY